MSAYGVLLAWPTAAVITFFAVVAGMDVDSHGTADDSAEPVAAEHTWLSPGGPSPPPEPPAPPGPR